MDKDSVDFSKRIDYTALKDEQVGSEELSSSDFESLLDELNKQVSTADGSISELMRKRDSIEQSKKELDDKLKTFEDDRLNFDKLMKEEYQKLNDQKIDFEQEKTKVFNEIQESREEMARKEREFAKYRQEQIDMIKESKKALAKNYEQFEKIVANFNAKIDKFN